MISRHVPPSCCVDGVLRRQYQRRDVVRCFGVLRDHCGYRRRRGQSVEQRAYLGGIQAPDVFHHEHLRVVVHCKALVGVSEPQSEGEVGLLARRRRFGQAGPAERVVHEAQAQQAGIRRLDQPDVIPELPGKQHTIVLAAGRIPLRQPRNGPVQPVAVQHQVVGLGEPLGDVELLARAVGIVHLKLANVVTAEPGQSLLPVLLENHRAARHVIPHPLARAHRRERLAVHAHHVCQRIQRRRAHDHTSARRHQRPRLAAAPLARATPQVAQHPAPEQQQERRNGQEVAQELDLESPGDEQVGHHPAQQQHLHPRRCGAHRQRREQRGQRHGRGGRDGQHTIPQQQHRRGHDPPGGDVGQAVRRPHAAHSRVYQPRQRHDAQRPAETPGRELARLVEVRRRVHVLPRVGVVPDAAHHLRLLRHVGQEAGKVQHGVGLREHEHEANGDRARKRAPQRVRQAERE